MSRKYGPFTKLPSISFVKDTWGIKLGPSSSQSYTAPREVKLPLIDGDCTLLARENLYEVVGDVVTGTTGNRTENSTTSYMDIDGSSLTVPAGRWLLNVNKSCFTSVLTAIVGCSGGRVAICDSSDNSVIAESQFLSVVQSVTYFRMGDYSNPVSVSGMTDYSLSVNSDALFFVYGGTIVESTTGGGAANISVPVVLTGSKTYKLRIKSNQSSWTSVAIDGVLADRFFAVRLGESIATPTPIYAAKTYATDWVTGDGTTKVVTHNLNTKDVMIQLINKATYKTILIDSEERTTSNTVTLTASEAPNASGWRVLITAL